MSKLPDSTLKPTPKEVSTHKSALSNLQNELSTLRSKRHTLHSRLSGLKAQVAQLEAEESDLEERIEHLEGESAIHSAWVAPYRRLAKEIIAEVINWHVKLQWNAPLVDSAVCKQWRIICIATPRLWSILRFPTDVPERFIQLWEERSRSIPLHVYIDSETIEPALNSFESVYCLKFRPWPTLLQGHTFTTLEKLILDHEDASVDHLEREVFVRMPKLRILHLHWFRLSRRPMFNWSWDLPPLEEFHFGSASWAWIDAVSMITSSLTRLALDIGDVPTPPPLSLRGTTLMFPELKYFAYGAQSRTLLINDSARVPIVSSVINAPNLLSFEDHSVTPLEFPIPTAENWSFPMLTHYLGRTSRELGDVKTLYPHIKIISFLVDPETGVLDVATLIDDAREGALAYLEELEMWRGERLQRHPMIEQSLREFEAKQGRKLKLTYLSGRDETLFQQCHFGFPCCRQDHTEDGVELADGLLSEEA